MVEIQPLEIKDVDKERLLKLSEISLWLDTYDDIFSDFDSREYSQRALSDDFLFETKKASRDKASGTIQLSFLVPKDKRNLSTETIIKKRLREHFKKHYHQQKNEVQKETNKGIFFTLIGIILMLVSAYLVFKIKDKNLLLTFVLTLFEPGGWFFFWQGLTLALFETKDKKTELVFYEKMTKCDIQFYSY